jgi:hypothetical protein
LAGISPGKFGNFPDGGVGGGELRFVHYILHEIWMIHCKIADGCGRNVV